MAKLRPKLLLLQARRRADPIRFEERNSFARRLSILPERIVCHDLLEGPPTIEEILDFDALLMGGSGEFYVSSKNLPQFEPLLDFLREVVDRSFPFFAACFGFQCLVEALGGEIVYDPGRIEVGTFELVLTHSGKRDPLLRSLPPVFAAQLGRTDRAQRLPPEIDSLASSERVAFQAFRIPEKPIWAFQFHPELNGEENRRRFIRYMNGYSRYLDGEERQAVFERFKPSPETERLLSRFLDIVFGEWE